MSIETTKDIIKQSRKLHNLLADYYHSISEKSQKPRLKLLLDYLEERERQIEETLSDIELTYSHNILSPLFSHTSCRERLGEISSLFLDDAESVDSVIEYFLEIDDCLILLYSELADKSSSKNLQEFFANLVRLEENHKIKAFKNASQIGDI